MFPARKTSGLGIFFIFVIFFISPLFAEEGNGDSVDEDPFLAGGSFSDEETLLAEEPSLDEETFLSEESSHDEEPSLTEEPSLDEEPLLAEEPSLGDEASLDEEPSLAEEPFSGEETLVREEEPSPGEEPLVREEEPSPDEEPTLAEEAPLDEDSLLVEEPSLEDEFFVFEAPPLIFEVSPIFESRSFNEIFPGLSRTERSLIMSDRGLKHAFEKGDSPMMTPGPNSGIDIYRSVLKKDPSHILEFIMVAPYNEKELDMLDVYNALGRVEDIKDAYIHANGRDIYLFPESTRLENARSRRSISDPPPAKILPFSETMYLRIKEAYFGNIFLKGDVSISLYGITYSLTNFTDIRFLLLPIMKEERLSIIIYLEPIKEGVLVYCMSGLYLPSFIANSVNLPLSMNTRVTVLINWLVNSFRKQEGLVDG
jgi:hypothetical protein